jgi:hypothetical protein
MKNLPYIRLGAVSVILVLLFYKPVKRLVTTPSAVHASWVEAHRPNPVGRVRELGVIDGKTVKEQYGDSLVDAIEHVNEQKRRLYAAYRKGEGKMGLSFRYSTVEGDPIFTWLLVEDGIARFIKDSTRDVWGSAEGVAIHALKTMRLGFMQKGRFVEGEPTPADSPVIVLELAYERGRELYH